MDAAVRVWPALARAVVPPELFGHVAEHVGRCIYEGAWVGEQRQIPHQEGLRLDVVAALTQLRAPVIRWPGGCFADDYHWRDGVGPQGERPRTANLWWRQIEPNTFGTPEFLRFCEAVGAAPYLCVNVGSGSPREARDWVEYCNFPGDSMLAEMRAKDGRPAPWGVSRWGIGNENWGCGGNYTGADYAKDYRRFATYMRAMAPEILLHASGASFGDYKQPVQNSWNHDFCEALAGHDLVDHVCLHRYFKRGRAVSFSDAEYFALFGDVLAMEKDLERTDAVLRYYFPNRAVGIAVDEWGVWHPEATVENGLEQPHTLRDALLAAAILHLFIRWTPRVTMANIAQTVNVLQCLAMTEGARMFLTPTYHVFDMMRPHRGARTLTLETDAPEFETRPVGFATKQTLPCLDVCASISGRKMHLTVVNKSLEDAVETHIVPREASLASVTGKVLQADDPRQTNDYETPSRITAKRIRPVLTGEDFVHTFPPHSFTALTITLS